MANKPKTKPKSKNTLSAVKLQKILQKRREAQKALLKES